MKKLANNIIKSILVTSAMALLKAFGADEAKAMDMPEPDFNSDDSTFGEIQKITAPVTKKRDQDKA